MVLGLQGASNNMVCCAHEPRLRLPSFHSSMLLPLINAPSTHQCYCTAILQKLYKDLLAEKAS